MLILPLGRVHSPAGAGSYASFLQFMDARLSKILVGARPSGRLRSFQRLALPLVAAICLLEMSACVLRPAWQQLAIEGNLESRRIDAGRFRHLVLWNGEQGPHLRIYVEGDGRPWIYQRRVAVDPTPSNPVLLRLMHDATHPAAYLGRPCYFGSATDRECEQRWWTFDRYGRVVVDSMCAAANQVSRQLGAETVQLIGYSGGGAIVIGMSACTDHLVAFSTIAGNLDPQAWAEHHGYSPLSDLSPLTSTAIRHGALNEVHWQCRDDLNVPPSITDDYFVARARAVRHIVKSCSHSIGWQRYWSQIIASPEVN